MSLSTPAPEIGSPFAHGTPPRSTQKTPSSNGASVGFVFRGLALRTQVSGTSGRSRGVSFGNEGGKDLRRWLGTSFSASHLPLGHRSCPWLCCVLCVGSDGRMWPGLCGAPMC